MNSKFVIKLTEFRMRFVSNSESPHPAMLALLITWKEHLTKLSRSSCGISPYRVGPIHFVAGGSELNYARAQHAAHPECHWEEVDIKF